MKKINIRIIALVLMAIIFVVAIPTNSFAATGSFSLSKSSVTLNKGGSTTITITGKNCEGQFSVSSSNSSVVSVSTSSVWVTGSSSFTLTAKGTGSATITVTATDVADTSENEVTGSKTISVKVSSGSSSSSSSKSTLSSTSSSNSSSSSSNEDSSSSTSTATPTFTSTSQTMYATGRVNVRSSYSTSSTILGALSAGDSVTVTGKATSAVDGITWYRITYNGQTAYVSASYLSSEEQTSEEEEEGGGLSSLSIEEYNLTPEFNSDVTEYTLKVPEDVTSLDIEATPEDENAQVEITGNDELLEETNTVTITVTAQDGTQKTYTITVTKGDYIELSDFGISLSEDVDYELTPELTSGVYEYTLNVYDLTVTSVDFNPVATDENAQIEVAGNTDLVPGENLVTIIVRSEDGSEIVTYQIVVNIQEEQEDQLIPGIDNEDLFLYGGIILAIIIIIIIIIAVVHHKKKKRIMNEYEPFYGGIDLGSEDDKNLKKPYENKNLDDTQDLSNVIKDKNIPETSDTTKSDSKSDKEEEHKRRKSVIEENFGADIKNDEDDYKPNKRKGGKHFS